ncbi:MAG TPA: hypothetical protein PLN21_00600 [Gemmatales bacterium]|nr:hypothetical protein [Gemmatales bacterium]
MKPDDFFIGWLPTPARYTQFLRPIILAALFTFLGIGLLVPSSQQSTGSAQWNEGDEVTLTGTVDMLPYAILRVQDQKLGNKTVFVVEMGKQGSHARLAAYQNQSVSLRGALLHRDERWMLELADEPNSIQAKPSVQAIPRPALHSLGTQTLRGEIVDSKCYLGAMKPGGGKTHKACAVLCLKGGIPPMFVTRDAQMFETYYLLTSIDGSALSADCYSYVGDRIEVQGQVEQQGDLKLLRLDAQNIRRR